MAQKVAYSHNFFVLNRVINDMILSKHNTKITLTPPIESGRQYISYRVTCNGKRLNLLSGISLTDASKQWDDKTNRVKHGAKVNGTSYNILNARINNQIKLIEDYFNNCDANEQIPSLDDLKFRFQHAFKSKVTEPAVPGVPVSDEFSYLFDQYIDIKSKERNWEKSMKEKFTRLKNRIISVKPDIRLTDLSESMMNTLAEEFAKTMYNDAIEVQFSSLKRFVKWAKLKHYPVNEDCLNYSPKLPKAKKAVRYLTLAELERIHNLDLSASPALERTRDLFLFQCGTALRHSDLKKLKPDNITQNEEGECLLRVLTEKDDDVITLPLTTYALEVYNKYKGHQYDKGLLFPVISNQKYNDQLKKIGELAELEGFWIDYEYKLNKKFEIKVPKSELASHTARRTFVVTAIEAGISPEIVALATSHSDLRAMKPYIKITNKGVSKVTTAVSNAIEEARLAQSEKPGKSE